MSKHLSYAAAASSRLPTMPAPSPAPTSTQLTKSTMPRSKVSPAELERRKLFLISKLVYNINFIYDQLLIPLDSEEKAALEVNLRKLVDGVREEDREGGGELQVRVAKVGDSGGKEGGNEGGQEGGQEGGKESGKVEESGKKGKKAKKGKKGWKKVVIA